VLQLYCLRGIPNREAVLDKRVKRAKKPCDLYFPSLWWLRKQAESNPRSVRIKMRVEYLWFNDICLRNITMLRIPFKTRLRAFVRKFSPFRAPPHEVVIRGISQDYFGRQMNASLSPLSTLRLEIAVISACNQRVKERWNILETLFFIFVSPVMTTHFCCVVWYGILNLWPCKACVLCTVILKDLCCTSLISFDEKHRSVSLYMKIKIKKI
jgi:hypothetical protein